MKRALLLVGSPKMERSTSNSIVVYLGMKLAEYGMNIEKMFTHRMDDASNLESLLSSVDSSDLVFLSTPLYVDSLPAPVMRVLQSIAIHRTQRSESTSPLFGVIINSGFPEAHQNDCVIEICRLFAKRADLTWAGGIAFGGGGAINGVPIEKAQGINRFLKPALNMTAKALSKGEPIPQDAISLAAKPIVPTRMYFMIASRRLKSAAKHYGVEKTLGARPFE
ncbi:hypothetical protein EU527_14730 [Candidatus Thorarchaeota archaeon]|nr:MAG: hypothetical protein EU527_14730 [Candidatus Thorarchaeota archaeon]